MKNRIYRSVCALLAVVLAWLPMQQATAGMIGTDAAVSAVQHQGNREKVLEFFSRDDVKVEMQRLGVSATAAAERVDRLSEAEIQRIAGQLDTAPAGALGGLIVIVLLGILVWALVIR